MDITTFFFKVNLNIYAQVTSTSHHSSQPSQFERDTPDEKGLIPLPPDRELKQRNLPTPESDCSIIADLGRGPPDKMPLQALGNPEV
jgi:hypothetical protein